MRLFIALFAAACAAPAPPSAAPAAPAEEAHTHAEPHRDGFADAEHWSTVFDDPARAAWQRPAELIASLAIPPGATVIEIGAGTGYFNPVLSAAVGPAGHVIAADIEPTLVSYMTARAEREQTLNVRVQLIDASRPAVPAADLALLVDTFHHITDRSAYFAHVGPQLGRGHQLVVVDFLPGELAVGPPDSHKVSPDQVTRELTEAGYVLRRSDTELLPYQFVHVYDWAPTLALLNDPPEGWTDLRAALPGAQFDIRYHTADNFTEAVLPGYGAEGAWLRDEPAQALNAVHAALADHGFGLRIYDAYRPLRGTLAMVAWAHRTDQVTLLDTGYIARRSGHNKGNTVDLSLYDLTTGMEPDMGTAWDTLSEASHTRNATGDALVRRLLLKQVMAEHGFSHYHKEWWHFTFKPDSGLAHRDVPYGCFEPTEGAWTAPDGWREPGYAMPTTWPADSHCSQSSNEP